MGGSSLWTSNINLLNRFNKAKEIFCSITLVLSILIITAATTANVEKEILKRV